jgi:hypothetical protein
LLLLAAAVGTSLLCPSTLTLLVLLLRLQMATAPQVIEFFMTLFCNTTRIVLLMERVPWRLLVQVRRNTWSSRKQQHIHCGVLP